MHENDSNTSSMEIKRRKKRLKNDVTCEKALLRNLTAFGSAGRAKKGGNVVKLLDFDGTAKKKTTKLTFVRRGQRKKINRILELVCDFRMLRGEMCCGGAIRRQLRRMAVNLIVKMIAVKGLRFVGGLELGEGGFMRGEIKVSSG